MNPKSLLKSKTAWAGLSGIIAALAGYFTGSMTGPEALNLGITGAVGIFLRDAVRKL